VINPSIGLAQPDQLALRVQDLERRMDGLAAANPLSRSSATDAAGKIRLRTGYLTPGNDAAGFGVELFDAAGVSVFRADENGIASGGQVRAIDVDAQYSEYLDTSIGAIATQLTNTHVRPAWATKALVQASYVVTIANGTANPWTLSVQPRINGTGGGTVAHTQSVPAGTTHALSVPNVRLITGVAGNVTVDGRASVAGTGSPSISNVGTLLSTVIWLR
jgi:hypothetical protein